MLRCIFGLFLFVAAAQRTQITQTTQVNRTLVQSSPSSCSSFTNCSACASANCTWFNDKLCNVSTAIAATIRNASNATEVALAAAKNASQCLLLPSVKNLANKTENATQTAINRTVNATASAANATASTALAAANRTAAAANQTAQRANETAQQARDVAENATQVARNASRIANNATQTASNITRNVSQTTQNAVQNASQTARNAVQNLSQQNQEDQDESQPVSVTTTTTRQTSLLKKGKNKGKKGKKPASSSSNSAKSSAAKSLAVSQKDCEAKDDMPFMPHGGRWQNPETCAMISCHNGIMNSTQCEPLACSTENRTCEPSNKCQPVPCDKPLPAKAQPIPIVAGGAFGDCIAMGTSPALKHGQTFQDKKTCFTYQCNNRVMTALACTSTVCSNGETKQCDPANDCKPAECGPDCPAQGEFPFMRNNQTIYNPATCDRYTCLNRLTTKESCLASVCTNGEAKPCDPSNNCKPQPCSSGDFAPPVLRPGTYIAPTATLVLDGTWLIPSLQALTSSWGAETTVTTTEYVLPSIFSSDCGEHKHGSTWEDMASCTTFSCFNGLTTSTSSCLMTMCPNGRLNPCDPANNCLSTCW